MPDKTVILQEREDFVLSDVLVLDAVGDPERDVAFFQFLEDVVSRQFIRKGLWRQITQLIAWHNRRLLLSSRFFSHVLILFINGHHFC